MHGGNIITFVIKSNDSDYVYGTFYSYEGTTWAEFINSSDNTTDKLSVDSNGYMLYNTREIYPDYSDGGSLILVKSTDKIIHKTIYLVYDGIS